MRLPLVLTLLLGGCDLVFSLDREPLTGWAEVDVGAAHVCARTRDGALACWGNNAYGQIGNGSDARIIDGPTVLGGTWTQVTTGNGQTCGLQGEVASCWGFNAAGQLGIGTMTGSPIPRELAGTWAHITTAYLSTCALDVDGGRWCWGYNAEGQLGDGTLASQSSPVHADEATWKVLSVGALHACGLDGDGSLWCWGRNLEGQLGDELLAHPVEEPARIGEDTWLSIAAANDTTCGVTTAGQLRCWGAQPLVDERDGWIAVDGAAQTLCGLRDDGEALCWGRGSHGQLASEATAAALPVAIAHPTGKRFTQISAGSTTTCLIDEDHALWCVGANGANQLADGGTSPREPALVVGAWRSVDAGNQVTCALGRFDGSDEEVLACAGRNNQYQLVSGDQDPRPRLTGLPGNWTAVTGGADHQCGLDGSARAYCWGDDYFGQLGEAAGNTETKVPVPVATAAQFRMLDAGTLHTCGLRMNGGVQCWGWGDAGQLGNGSATAASTPVDVTGLTGAVALSAGGNHTCAITSANAIVCWGSNMSGELGDGTATNRAAPVPLSPATPVPAFTSVSAGSRHTCAVGADGSAWCWGANDSAQLLADPGFALTSSRPLRLPENTWASIAAGDSHTCGVRTDNTLWCWGANHRGQLGDGTLDLRRAAVQIGGAEWIRVSAGIDHTCGKTITNETKCWGNNDEGATAHRGWQTELVEIVSPSPGS